MSERVTEDEPRTGRGWLIRMSVEIDPDTELSVSLPHSFTHETVGEVTVSYVIELGTVLVYAGRPELERLHKLIGRALEQDAARNEEGDV